MGQEESYLYSWSPIGAPLNVQREEDHWRQFDNSVNAVSFGFVATAILISMFLVMAIFERFLRPNSSPTGPNYGDLESQLSFNGKLRHPSPNAMTFMTSEWSASISDWEQMVNHGGHKLQLIVFLFSALMDSFLEAVCWMELLGGVNEEAVLGLLLLSFKPRKVPSSALDLSICRTLETRLYKDHYSMQMTVYTSGVSVLMPGDEIPTFIAHPAPVPCPPECSSLVQHQHCTSGNPVANSSGNIHVSAVEEN
ncbi:hypothetical protein CXB51_014742 [Gossypium anomalum]|uniref:Uncharacterized protein n=1 Tax=Gossypium anomalum TaxID=47600 RepID=A0A8J5Z991_9ROSI|nr:hypothetical protein CXB51_014742 [Gossypium anomalum]